MGGDIDKQLDLQKLHVKIFADGADAASIRELCKNPLVKGFTTNPTIMRSAGIDDYESFARSLLETIGNLPISFEVFSDEQDEMERQARKIASWRGNVYVKIPITNTRGESTATLVRRLSSDGIQLNITAVMTLEQVECARAALQAPAPAYVSIFAGRIADSGIDPIPAVREAVSLLADRPNIELIWASPREVLNVFHAESAGCHIITLTYDLIKKLSLVGTDLNDYSLETVRMFHRDAAAAKLVL
jgi:transaldolase